MRIYIDSVHINYVYIKWKLYIWAHSTYDTPRAFKLGICSQFHVAMPLRLHAPRSCPSNHPYE